MTTFPLGYGAFTKVGGLFELCTSRLSTAVKAHTFLKPQEFHSRLSSAEM